MPPEPSEPSQPSEPSAAARLLAAARDGGDEAAASIPAVRESGRCVPLPGEDTAGRWHVLAAVAEVNLTTARVLEAHTDALAILAEAGDPERAGGAWGVFAAEGPNVRLDAITDDSGSVRLTGLKPWCSLAALLDAALVTAHTPAGRQLFRVDLHDPGVTPEPASAWAARGLRTVVSAPVRFDDVPAQAVGAPGWYLTRPGFAWGGLGVAACWYGGAVGVLTALRRRATEGDDVLDLAHFGAADAALHGARVALDDAAHRVDAGDAYGPHGELLALRVRAVVADAVERTLRHAAHALGPAPLAFDADHAARVADLELYVRQHHAERDLAQLGRALTEIGP